MRLRLLALLLLLAAPIALAPGAGAYRAEGRAWPGGLIPYYNAAADQAWAVGQAVNVWNTSGARVRFVAVPRESARLVIRSTERTSCTRAHATLGHVARATVWIWARDMTSPTCDPYWAAGALAHELGHVLGLGHEGRGCATMNPSGNRRGPAACTPVEPWQWRCRLLERDDVTGAVALYGGAVREPRRRPGCDLYGPLAPPSDVAATLDGDLLRVTLRRPPALARPVFLAARSGPESYAALWSNSGCPAPFEPRAPRYRWNVSGGAVAELGLRVPAGARCLSVWAVDGLGRPSARPASVSLGR